MKQTLLFAFLLLTFSAFSQREADSIYSRCPVAIKDTVTGNNYFIEHQPAIVKTYRNNGNFTIVIDQKNQFFTIFFPIRKLSTKRNGKFFITADANNRDEMKVKYSFRSGESVAFLDVVKGKVETIYNKTTKQWNIKVNGLIANMGVSGVSYFKATADFHIR